MIYWLPDLLLLFSAFSFLLPSSLFPPPCVFSSLFHWLHCPSLSSKLHMPSFHFLFSPPSPNSQKCHCYVIWEKTAKSRHTTRCKACPPSVCVRETLCTSLQTDNHANTSSLNFYRPDALADTQPTVSKHWRHLKALKTQKYCMTIQHLGITGNQLRDFSTKKQAYYFKQLHPHVWW